MGGTDQSKLTFLLLQFEGRFQIMTADTSLWWYREAILLAIHRKESLFNCATYLSLTMRIGRLFWLKVCAPGSGKSTFGLARLPEMEGPRVVPGVQDSGLCIVTKPTDPVSTVHSRSTSCRIRGEEKWCCKRNQRGKLFVVDGWDELGLFLSDGWATPRGELVIHVYPSLDGCLKSDRMSGVFGWGVQSPQA